MNKKKIAIVVATLILIAVVVVACQGSGEKETAEPTKNEVVSESTAIDVKADDKTSSSNKNNASSSDKNTNTSNKNNSSSSDKKNDSSSSSTKPTTHTHSWTAVYATKQVQVGTEYKCVDSIIVCNCGAKNVGRDHAYAHTLAGEPSNTHVEEIWKDVPVYESQKYVDYYKCSCGATK